MLSSDFLSKAQKKSTAPENKLGVSRNSEILHSGFVDIGLIIIVFLTVLRCERCFGRHVFRQRRCLERSVSLQSSGPCRLGPRSLIILEGEKEETPTENKHLENFRSGKHAGA